MYVSAAIVGLGIRAAVRAAYGDERSPKQVTIIEFSDDGKRIGPVTVDRIVKTDAEWHKVLTPEQFKMTRQQGTERACSVGYWNNHDAGLYRCICCGTALFKSDTKFESGTGWPSFWTPVATENLELRAGQFVWHGAHGGAVQTVRGAFGARVRGRTAADGVAVLHELGGDEICEV